MIRSGFRLLTIVLLVGFFASVVFLIYGRPAGYGRNAVDVRIQPGMSVYQAAEVLQEKNLLRSRDIFMIYLRIRANSKIQRGLYELHDGMSVYEIADTLHRGKVKTRKLTIPEGWNHRQIAAYLAETGMVASAQEFLDISKNSAQLKEYRLKNSEGYLFPDTYHVPHDYDVEEFHGLLLRRFFAVVEEITGGQKFSAEKLHKRVILASIVEREAFVPAERPVIAQVFLNRIQRDMKLESCATVQYLFPMSKKKLYFKDLKKPSRYNTYLHKGYPPGPISNPGRASLQAAFHPSATDFLYFVVKSDRSHFFSTTFADHLRAKEKYIGSNSVIWQGL